MSEPETQPPVTFRELTISTRNGERTALVVEPRGRRLLGLARLERMRAQDELSDVDHAILHRVRERIYEGPAQAGGPIHGVVFRARGRKLEPGRWGFDSGLTAAQKVELAGHLLRAHIRLLRELEPMGVLALIGVDFGKPEIEAYERATDSLVESWAKRRGAGPGSRAGEGSDLWRLEHQAVWSGMPFSRFLEGKLGPALVTAERQHRRFAGAAVHGERAQF